MRRFKTFLIVGLLVILSKNVYAQELLQFQGTLDLVNKALELQIKPEVGVVEFSAKLQPNSNFALSMKLKHVKIGLLDILADIYSSGRVYYGDNKVIKRIKFDVSAVNLLVNHKPVEEIFMSGQINNYVLRINSLEGFNSFLLGYLDLRKPYDIDIITRIKPFSLFDFADLFGRKDPNILGEIEGVIKLEGMLFFPQINASLVIYDGTIEGVPFKEAVINFSGAYPLVRFVDSKIFGENDELLDLSGFLDLSKLDNLESPFHNFKLEPTGNQIRVADWNLMKKNLSDKECSFTKEVDDSLSVAFESYMRDETRFRDYNKDAFELRYKFNSGPDLNMKMKEDEGTLGLEKRIEF